MRREEELPCSSEISSHSNGKAVEALVVTIKELDLIVVTIYKSPASTTEEMTTMTELFQALGRDTKKN